MFLSLLFGVVVTLAKLGVMLMPMGAKGHKVMSSFMKQYGEKKGKSFAYASAAKKGKKSKIYAALHSGK